MKKDDLVFVGHILDSIEKIQVFIGDMEKGQFEKDELKQYAVMRAIEIIGEASKNISSDFKKKYAEISWADMIRMRDKVIHNYFGIDLNIVWDTVTVDI